MTNDAAVDYLEQIVEERAPRAVILGKIVLPACFVSDYGVSIEGVVYNTAFSDWYIAPRRIGRAYEVKLVSNPRGTVSGYVECWLYIRRSENDAETPDIIEEMGHVVTALAFLGAVRDPYER